MTHVDTNAEPRSSARKSRMMIGCAAAFVVAVALFAGFIALMVSLSETVTESYDRRRAAMVGEWVVGLQGGRQSAEKWTGTEALTDGDYRWFDFIRFGDDGRYERRSLLFKDETCYALFDSGRWDPDRDSEADYVQLDAERTDFGCYRIERASPELMRTTATMVGAFLASGRPWDFDAESDPDLSKVEAAAGARTSYRIATGAVGDETLELDLNEGASPLRKVYRPYDRVEPAEAPSN